MTYATLKEIKAGSELIKKYSSIMRMWTLPVILSIGRTDGIGFNKIKKDVPGINPTTLSLTLRQFEKYGLVERTIIPSRPVRINYNITEKGMEFYDLALKLTEFIQDLDIS
ncbi:MAG: helix-turn-helix domain-containing protein [Ferroplasma sp.]